jgi:hypothetical protein
MVQTMEQAPQTKMARLVSTMPMEHGPSVFQFTGKCALGLACDWQRGRTEPTLKVRMQFIGAARPPASHFLNLSVASRLVRTGLAVHRRQSLVEEQTVIAAC